MCLPRLVVHCVYPIWWSILFTPFVSPMCLPHLVVLCVYPVWWSILFTRLVVHCVYPIWWSIAFTPFGGPLCLACDSTAVGTQTLEHVRYSATVGTRFCDTTAVGTQTLKRICDSTAVGTHVVRNCFCIATKPCDIPCASCPAHSLEHAKTLPIDFFKQSRWPRPKG